MLAPVFAQVDAARPGSKVVRCVPSSPLGLGALIMCAYDARPYQLDGPWWVVKFEPTYVGRGLPDELKRDATPETVRRVLADRLGLKVHRETRIDEVYVLLVGEGGPKLTKSSDGPHGESRRGPARSSTTRYDLEFAHISIAQFAQELSRWLKRGVIDGTRLSGQYDITMHADLLAIEGLDDGGIPVRIPDWILESLGQLGLTLDKRRAPVEHLVIDEIKMPARD